MDSKLFLEIRRTIGIIQVYISVREKIVVKIKQDRIEIAGEDGAAKKQHGLLGYKVLPNSCKNLRYVAGEGLHFRLTLEEKNISQKGEVFPLEHLNKVTQYDADYLCQQVPPGNEVLFICATCGHIVTHSLMFKRVLPLPSESWQEICGNAFCHGDKNFTADALAPKVDDCFISKMDYVLHSSVLNNEPDPSVMKPNPSHCVYCRRCRSLLGRYKTDKASGKLTNVISLSQHCVQVKNSGQPIPSLISDPNNRRWIENWLACQLVTTAKEKFCHRFMIMDDTAPNKKYICVWLLCPNMSVMCNTYLGQNEGSVWQKFTGQSTCEVESEDQPAGLDMFETAKVLYKCESDKDGEKTFTSWTADNSVSPLYLQHRYCLLLLLILTESTISLPPSLQCSNNFKNGYLRYTDVKTTQ